MSRRDTTVGGAPWGTPVPIDGWILSESGTYELANPLLLLQTTRFKQILEDVMKKIFAVLTILAITSFSLSASAACGSNTNRNSSTRAPGSTSGSTGTMGPAAGAGMGPGSVLPR